MIDNLTKKTYNPNMYEDNLIKCAVTSKKSKGRKCSESNKDNIFLTDKERILQSKSWRRLEYKTQVFVNSHESTDHFRNRLTHSLEVANTAKIISRNLGLNEDLAECIGLAHDLGHTPFGHAGQDALNDKMKNYSGFEHNYQSVRVVTELDNICKDVDGLNLSYEVIEGLIKHRQPSEMIRAGKFLEYNLSEPATLEAQIANFSDELTYNCHDLDDGYRSGIISFTQLSEITLFQECLSLVSGCTNEQNTVLEVIRAMKWKLVKDVVKTTALNISGFESLDDIRSSHKNSISFSKEMRVKNGEIKKFLHKQLYFECTLERRNHISKKAVSELFDIFFNNTKILPLKYQNRIIDKVEKHGEEGKARVISDYISGMTDRYALDEYNRLVNLR